MPPKHTKRPHSTLPILSIILITLAIPTSASACGMPLAASIPSAQTLITYTNGHEEIITSITLKSQHPGAAIIFPIPSIPDISTTAPANLFDYLADVTQPQQRTEERLTWNDQNTTQTTATTPTNNLIEREIIGGYDIARLAANDPHALQHWLDTHNYHTPAGAEPILRTYIEQKWTFVAIKLAPNQLANGPLAPIRIAFDTPEIIYPMRLGTLAEQPLDLLLYIATDHRVTITNMETLYAGTIAQLERTPPPEITTILQAPYLTKLRNQHIQPAILTHDFIATPTGNDEPYRATELHIIPINGWRRMAFPIIGLVTVLITSSIALGFAFGIRRRIDQIAGPDPDRDNDDEPPPQHRIP